MFLEIDWLGPQTKPMYDVAFATTAKEHKLREWLSHDAEYKRTTIISSADATKLRKLFASPKFMGIRTKVPPKGNFQGYVIACDSNDGTGFYQIGFDSLTLGSLNEIRLNLGAEATAALDVIVNRLP